MEERFFKEDWYVSGNMDNVIPFPGNWFVNDDKAFNDDYESYKDTATTGLMSGIEHYDRRKRHLRKKLMIRLASILRSVFELAGCAATFAYIMYQVYNWLMYI